ncbi:TniB family NTP-binding protein [Paraburkholderia sp. MMS20-SJTN17]|uniref:TniB family NTP-binding protein n=1 Tax=Paraburkholderia translucens TaxID=2886945 RepID=A0ABS8KC13_9BURK|nr:TniB family NTP-binding protein [Paraburkholderia sp. MMS20-SJTN17]MCC8402008.1 TniB family NTP-binding protein [Paraburkholderia sp. MMS20-SJTN17]
MTPAQQLRRDIETCELPHKMFVEHLTALKRRIDDALMGFAPKIIRVPGPSGVGKSSLIAKLSRDYPEIRIDGRRHVPVLVVEVPQSATAKLLPKSVLRALGIQVPGNMTAGTMFDLMVTQLRLAGTRVVIFDEVSHLVDEGSRVPPRAASDWLKALADALDITLILFGIPRLERLFSANEQLRRRACPALNFLPYDATIADQMTAYVACVVNYARLFSAVGYPIDVPSRVLTQQSYLLTGGLVGVLADFMRELASLMANEAPRAITYADCQKATEYVSHAGSPHRLAFQDSGDADASVEPAALKQAYVHVLTSNAASVPVRKKSGDKQ